MSDLTGHPWRPAPDDAPAPPPTAPPPEPPRTEGRPRRPLHRKKRFLFPMALVLVGLGVLAASWWGWKKAEERRAAIAAERARFADYLAERETELEAAFEAVPLLTAQENRLLRRSPNAVHLENAQRFGLAASIPNRDGIEDGTEGLRRLDRAETYWVSPLTHSVPFATPDAAAALDSIGARFWQRLGEAGLPSFRYNLSSVLRTQEDQQRLRGVNVNAARGTSSHEFGTTFDIHFRRYRPAGDPAAEVDEVLGPTEFAFLRDEFAAELEALYERMRDDYVSRLKAVLGRSLIELEDEGKLVTVMERRQPVFHTTVATRLAGDADAAVASP